MRPTEFSADMIVALLRKQTVASLSEVMAALGTGARRTAFRKLKGLATRTRHRGGYYTLDERVEFDQRGLWSFDGVRFSSVGTLIATAESFVNQAQAGHFEEFAACRRPGRPAQAVGDGRLRARGPVPVFACCYARTRASPARRRPDAGGTIVLFAIQRHSPGWSHSSSGWGGDRRIAGLLGIDPATVSTGRRQLVERDVDLDRVRRVGGGRPPAEKKRRKSSPASKP